MHYLSIEDIDDLSVWVEEALALKAKPWAHQSLGQNKTLGLLFFNPSLRTRLSTQKAAHQLGLNCLLMNIDKEGWALEFQDGVIMNQGKAEHIKDAAQVIAQYCDLIAIRAFPELKSREEDEQERVLRNFVAHAGVPVINMESSTGHPLQALADAISMSESLKQDTMAESPVSLKGKKVVLSWAPHPRALPHAVANSFVQMMKKQEAEFVITHPPGYELNEMRTAGQKIEYDQKNALQDADFVYVKNWSSYRDYGKVLSQDPSWMIDEEKMKLTRQAKFMHCLPVRRNVVVSDGVMDGPNALVFKQAENRTYAAQLVLKKILESKKQL